MTNHDGGRNEVTEVLAAQDLPTALDKFIDAGKDHLAPRLRAAGQEYLAAVLEHLLRSAGECLTHERAIAVYGARVPKSSPAGCAGATGVAVAGSVPPEPAPPEVENAEDN